MSLNLNNYRNLHIIMIKTNKKISQINCISVLNFELRQYQRIYCNQIQIFGLLQLYSNILGQAYLSRTRSYFGQHLVFNILLRHYLCLCLAKKI